MEIEREYGVVAEVYIPLVTAGSADLKATPTLAAGDIKISKDGGAFVNLAALPTVTPAGGIQVKVSLNATEREAKTALIVFIDQTATKEWEDQTILVRTKDPYNGCVHIDTVNGTAGTAFPTGSKIQPVDNLADAKTIAEAENLSSFCITGSVTLTAAYKDWTFKGESVDAEVDIAGYDVKNSVFEHITIKGTGNGAIRAKDCTVDGLSEMDGKFYGCGIKGTNVLAATASVLWSHCYSEVPGLSTPVLDFGVAGSAVISIRAYSGGLQVENADQAANIATIELIAGRIVSVASCTAGTIVIRGVGTFSDSSTGTTINTDGFVDGVEFANIHKWVKNKLVVGDTEIILYEDDGVTPRMTWPWNSTTATRSAAT